MDPELVCALLNDLLAAEQRAMARRLFESTVFVSQLSVTEAQVARRIAHQIQRNCERLTTMILEYNGVPNPRLADQSMAHLHYQDLHYVFPLMIADHQALVRKYELASQQIAQEPRAADLVVRILELHRSELDELREIRETATGVPAERSS